MFGYIYKTTNLLNGKIYVGKHKWSKEGCLDENYLGSGTYLTRAIDKYGKENFICEILDTADSLEELNEKERFYIEELDAMNQNIGYNLTRGGDGTYLPGRFLGDSKNPVVREKISSTLKVLWEDEKSVFNSTRYRESLAEGVSNSHKEGKRKDTYEKISKAKMGHTVSQETRDKISKKLKEDSEVNRLARQTNKEKHQGKTWINNGEKQLFIKGDLALNYLNSGWVRGRLPYSEETIKNMTMGNRRHADLNRLRGKTVCIHKDGKNKYVFEDELDLWLAKGYTRGGIKGKRRKEKSQEGKD